jgi:hypothetical protein
VLGFLTERQIMGVTQTRTVSELVRHSRSGPPRRFVLFVVAVGALVAVMNGESAARTVGDRARALARVDHLVKATLTYPPTPAVGRAARGTAVATWVDPAGTPHHSTLTTPPGSRATRTSLWLDAAGLPTAGPPSTLMVVAAAVFTGLRTLLEAGLLLGASLVILGAWRRRQVRVAVEARWRSLVHELWEDL